MVETAFVKVAVVGELSPGDMKMVEVGDDQIVLANVGGNIFASDNLCTHAFALSMAEACWATGAE